MAADDSPREAVGLPSPAVQVTYDHLAARPTILEPLSDWHDISQFECDKSLASPQIGRFLAAEALGEQKARFSATHVLRFQGERRVRAYITIALGSIYDKEKDFRIPSIHIAYVGICKRVKKLGWGRHLITWAIRRAEVVQETFGCRYIHLQCYEDVKQKYLDMGFTEYDKPRSDEVGPRYSLKYDILAAIAQAAREDAAAAAMHRTQLS